MAMNVVCVKEESKDDTNRCTNPNRQYPDWLYEVMLRCIVMCQENSKDVTYVVLVGWYTCG